MNNKPKNLSFFLFLAFCFYQLIVSSCAQVASPPGGKKDTLSPVLISTIPAQKSKNYGGKKIELIFNEYVDIKNISQELLVTPGIGFYETKINPKGFSLTVDSSFKKNTTYTFNFRNAVSDISERNIAKNVKVVFSTGNTIDSLSVKGQVVDLKTNKKVDNALIALYPFTDTLNLEKTKPYYFTKTDTTGTYQMENLAAGKYFALSFMDQNNNLIVNTNKEAYSFVNQGVIDLNKSIESLNFKLSLQNLDSVKIVKTITTAKSIAYELNRGIKKVEISSKQHKNLAYQIENKPLIRLFKSDLPAGDTLFLNILVEDSLNRIKQFAVKSVFRELNKKEKAVRKPFNFNVYPKPGEKYAPTDSIQLDFEKPLSNWNPQKIYFKKDSLTKIYLKESDILLNAYKNSWIISSQKLPKENSKLIFEKNAFISIEQDSSDAYEMAIEKEELENYGLISGKLSSFNKTKQYIVQLIDEQLNEIAYSQKCNTGNFSFVYIKPSIYTIRVIEDLNNDGQWSPGNLSKRLLPERMFFLSGKLKLKANFELTDLLINVE